VNLILLVIVGCSGEFFEHGCGVLGTTKARNFVTIFVTISAIWSLFVC
jgi:hypothetical protein